MEEILSRLRLERLTPRTITDTEELLLTRERGYATNDEEHEEGVRAVGVPVIGRPAAALSVATLTFVQALDAGARRVRPALEESRKGGRGAVAMRWSGDDTG